MPIYNLTEVEGGAVVPKGSIVEFPSAYPDVFSLEGVVYSRDNVPGRVIPDFSTEVNESVKGFVNDPTLCLALTDGNTQAMAAGIGNDGTIIRVRHGGTNDFFIDRKLPTETFFSNVKAGTPYYGGNNSAPAIVSTNGVGVWLIASEGALHRSMDNGLTWNAVAMPAVTSSANVVTDITWSDVNTVILCSRRNASLTATVALRSTDAGLSFAAVSTAIGATVYIGSNTWYGIKEGSNQVYKSTDNGLTWATDGVLSFTPAAGAFIHMKYSSGTYYLHVNTTVYTGVTMNTAGALTGTYSAMGVDNAGNAVLVKNTSPLTVVRSVAGAAVVDTKTHCSVISTGSDLSRLLFANDTWVDVAGAYITNTDLLAGKGWYNFSLTGKGNNVKRNYGARASDGTILVALNMNTYLRSTDDGLTWVPHPFTVDASLSGSNIQTVGLATDNNGTWVMAISGSTSPRAYVSTDNGLTWVNRSVGAGSTIKNICGSTVAGVFLVTGTSNAAWYTNNAFTSVSNKAGALTTSGSANAVWDGNAFYWITFTGTSFALNSVNAAGTLSTHTLSEDLTITTGEEYMHNHGNALYIKTWVIFGGLNTGATSLPTVGGTSVTVKNIVNGEVNAVNSTADLIQLGPNVLLSVTPSRTEYMYTKGIKDMSLPATSFIKVK